MKKDKSKYLRPEFIVVVAIAVFLVAGSLFVNVNPAAAMGLPVIGKAPDIVQGRWINSQPLNMSSLRGRVVLIDFWTYTCINCIRALPYINAWYAKYADKGLVIIGVHTPEFEFEKDYANVKAAVERYGVKYPVVQDNNYATWNAYGNHYWPHHYLIDKDGNIRYDHIGEGSYDETEKAIQDLLGETGMNVTTISTNYDLSQIGSPEIYLGYQFARSPLGNPEGFSPESIVNYKYINITEGNVVYLSGQWRNDADKIVAVNNSKLFLIYRAKNVNIVAEGADIRVKMEGFPLPADFLGSDTGSSGIAKINEQRLYNIISAPSYMTRMMEIDAQPGFGLYTFTFG